MTKKANKLIRIAILVVLAAPIGVVGISIYVGWRLTHPQPQLTKETPAQYGMKYENVSFKSELDGLSLKGWYIPGPESDSAAKFQTVIFAHGYNDERAMEQINALKLAKTLHSHNYNLLLFDFRNSGESEKSVTSIGAFEKYDLLSAIKFAKVEKKSDQVAVIGWSMGAVASILSAAECTDLDVIIADSPFADLEEYLESNLHIWSYLPNFPFTPIIMNSIPIIEGIDVSSVSPIRAVTNLKKHQSLLLIHSKSDVDIPYENSVKIREQVPGGVHAEIWITREAEHVMNYLQYRQEYEKRIIAFLELGFR